MPRLLFIKQFITAKHTEKTPANFEDAITKTGFGAFNVLIFIIGGGCLMCVTMETMGMMFIIPSAVCDLQLDLANKGLLASISFLGVVSSSHLWGFLADTKGRRNVLLISMALGFVTSFLSSMAPTAWAFILCRYFNGFFIGGGSAVIYAYVGEFHNQLYRPKIISLIAAFVAVGNIILPALSWIILPLEFSVQFPLGYYFRPWRLLVICMGFPNILVAIGLYFLPESPKCLLSLDKHDEALETLKKMYALNMHQDREDFPVSNIIWDEVGIESKKKNANIVKSIRDQTVPLFKFPYLKKTFMICLLQFGAFASSSGLFMWYPEILNKMEQSSSNRMCDAMYSNISNNNTSSYNNSSSNTEEISCSDVINTEVYKLSLAVAGALTLLYILIGSIIGLLGGKSLLIFFLIATASCGIAAQLIRGSLLVKILVGLFLMSAACIGIINTIAVELFPTHLRGMALAISLMSGRCGAVAGSHLAGHLIYIFCDYTFYVFGLDHLILVTTTFLLPISS